MRKRLWILPLVALFLGGCNLNEAHNREHRAKWRESFRELHDQVDRFIIDPLTHE